MSAQTDTSNRKGFTLIELMISIVIIAIISAVGLVSYSKAQELGRDAKRKQDLRTIAIALELYHQKNGQYPVKGAGAPGDIWYSNDTSDPWIGELNQNYINSVPRDPINNGGLPWSTGETRFGYMYWSGDTTPWACGIVSGQFFALAARLENKNDPDRLFSQNYKWCDGRSLVEHGWSPEAFVVTSQ